MLTALGAMKLAIHEGQRGLGFVAPNPAVGCVIVDASGHLLAKGYHRKYGSAHAEVDALEKIKDASLLKGAIIYVTLEPCAHEGKTPSCAKRLATLPIKKVVYGLVDPFPKVSGKGVEIIRAAGIEVEQIAGDPIAEELEELAEVFLFNQRKHMPFVSLKVATSLDGHLAHVSGESRWITDERAREESHVLRAHHDAVLVGKNTFLRDDPSLDIRHTRFAGKKNKAIILDGSGEVTKRLPESKLARAHSAEDIIVSGRTDLRPFLEKCYADGITSILVEGGAEVISSFLQQKLAQRFYQFMAPQIIGGASGVNFSRSFSIPALDARVRLRNPKFRQLDDDMLVTGLL